MPVKRALAVEDWLLSLDRLDAMAEPWPPLGFVDLDGAPSEMPFERPPPFPLVGIGDPEHPLAARLDAVVEPPVSAAAVLEGAARAPRAAAAVTQLLRATESLAAEPALVLESLCFGLLQGSAEHAAWLAGRPAPEAVAGPGSLILDREGATLRMVIDRPWARNAIDRALRDQLCEAFEVAALDPEIETVTLSSTGPIFSVGADLDEFGVTRDPATAHLIRMRTLPALALQRCADRLHVHVQGGCVGSALELAAFARRITATRDAWFQLPELAMGIIPGAGGCVSVPRRIGRRRAALMILSGRRISAPTALGWGLVDEIVDAAPGDEGGADQG